MAKTIQETEGRLVNKWEEKNGIITTELFLLGLTGHEVIKRMSEREIPFTSRVREMLREFGDQRANPGVCNIAIVKGVLFDDHERNAQRLFDDQIVSSQYKCPGLNPEIIYQLRINFSQEELRSMGLRWILQINPIPGNEFHHCVVQTLDIPHIREEEPVFIDGHYSPLRHRWKHNCGFIFERT